MLSADASNFRQLFLGEKYRFIDILLEYTQNIYLKKKTIVKFDAVKRLCFRKPTSSCW